MVRPIEFLSQFNHLITQIAERISDNVYQLIRQQHYQIEPLRNGPNKVSKRNVHDDTFSNEFVYIFEDE